MWDRIIVELWTPIYVWKCAQNWSREDKKNFTECLVEKKKDMRSSLPAWAEDVRKRIYCPKCYFDRDSQRVSVGLGLIVWRMGFSAVNSTVNCCGHAGEWLFVGICQQHRKLRGHGGARQLTPKPLSLGEAFTCKNENAMSYTNASQDSEEILTHNWSRSYTFF